MSGGFSPSVRVSPSTTKRQGCGMGVAVGAGVSGGRRVGVGRAVGLRTTAVGSAPGVRPGVIPDVEAGAQAASSKQSATTMLANRTVCSPLVRPRCRITGVADVLFPLDAKRLLAACSRRVLEYTGA